jgi:hypothetical protein
MINPNESVTKDYPFMAMAGMAPNAGGGLAPGMATGSGSGQALAQVDHVRSVFPETWLWTNTTTGYDVVLTYSG